MSTAFLDANNANIMYMDYYNGNIGIGHYDPLTKFDVAGDVHMRSNVKVTGIVSLCNMLNVQGIFTSSNVAYMQSNMIVSGNATFSNPVSITSNLGVSGNAAFLRNVNMLSNLTVDGQLRINSSCFLRSNLVVTSDATFSNNIIGLSNVNVLGVVSLSNRLGVSNLANFESNVFVAGAATFSNVVTLGSNDGFVTLATSNNNLGISAPFPLEKLEVGGKIRAWGQMLGQIADSSNNPAFSFFGNSNTGIYRPDTDTMGLVTGGVERMRLTDIGFLGIGVSNPSKRLHVFGDTLLDGTVDVKKNAMFESNVTIMGQLTVSNVTYVTSNIYIYNSEFVQSNLTVTGDFSLSNIAFFDSNVFIKGVTVATGDMTLSNNLTVIGTEMVHGTMTLCNNLIMGKDGLVTFSTSNNRLGLNLSGSTPRADLDMRYGNILSKNIQRLSKSADNSNPIGITINWDNAYNSNNLYHIVADVTQTIANSNDVGYRSQRIAIAVSNSEMKIVKAPENFGSVSLFTTLALGASNTTSNSITIRSATNASMTGDYVHGLNVDIVHFPHSDNIGSVFLS